MKVNINKGKTKKTYNLITSWDDVTLEKWQKLLSIKGKNTKKDIDMIKILSDIPDDLLNNLDLIDIVEILKLLTDLQKIPTNKMVRKTYDIDGVKYGFHPNLEKLTLGEYIDIETLIGKGVSENLHYIMAILFRPVISKSKHSYTIEAYNESSFEDRAQIFKSKMRPIQVQSALVFFWNLGKQLKGILETYSVKKLKMMSKDIIQKNNLTKSMAGIV